jgi:dGTPase
MSPEDGPFRQAVEEQEASLSPYAVKSRSIKGRAWSEPPDPLRTAFHVDRDRILHAKAFRRLMHKTQVFMAPLGDHYTTRLSHTLEVMQIARTITRVLNLNEDLAEAIALGHDLGHTPFGHLGEQVLGELVPGGFRHNRQSLRVVEKLENGGRGLNLTWEVRQGILRHSKGRDDIVGKASPEIDSLEAQVVKIADALAYLNHDLEDAYRAGVLSPQEVPPDCLKVMGKTPLERIKAFVGDIVEHSWPASGQSSVPEGTVPRIIMGPEMNAAANKLRDFLFQRVYLPEAATPQAERARDILRMLFLYFLEHPEKIPEGYTSSKDPLERMAADYISGMTDRYALLAAEQLKPGITAGLETRVTLPV